MALGNRRSHCGIAAEASFGSLSSGIPAASGLTYINMEVNRSVITYTGQIEPKLQRDIARAGTGRYAPETEAPYVGGTKQRRRYGTVKLGGPLRCNGSTAMASTAMHLVYNTVMTRAAVRGAGASDTINDAGATVYGAQVTSPGAAQIGELIAFELDGGIEVVRVTDTGGGAGPLTWTPNLSDEPANGATYRYCNTYFPTIGELALATFKPVAIRMGNPDKLQYATGCRMNRLLIECAGTDERSLRWEADFEAAAIYDDDSNAASVLANPTITTGGIAKFLETGGAIYSPDNSAEAVPHNSAGDMTRTVLAARRWSLEVIWTLEGAGHGGSYLRCAEWFCADVMATLSFPDTDPASVFEDSAKLNEYRTWVVPNGPSNGAGNGMAVCIPAGNMPDFVESAISDTRRTQNLAIADGPYAGDTGSEAQTSAVRKSFALGFVA